MYILVLIIITNNEKKKNCEVEKTPDLFPFVFPPVIE